MPAFILAAFVIISCLIAWQNWRAGLLLTIVAGLIQDPIRKVTPDIPAYLTLSFLPIYFVLLARLWSSTPVLVGVERYYPQLRNPGLLFALTLLASTAQTMSYGANALALALLGLFSYAGGVPALFLGFFLIRRDFRELDRPLMVVVVLLSLMLIGVPLEYFGYKFSQPWLGTIGMTGTWRRWYSDHAWVEMLSGFYRAPEIMGWHAATLLILCVYLMTRRPAFAPIWGVIAAWGFSCMLLSGRRKMFLMVCVFLLVFLLFSPSRRKRTLLICLLFGLGAIALLMPFLVDDRYVETASSSLPAAGMRITGHAFSGPLWLLGVVGLFGFGVGTKTQGAQHLGVEIPAPLTEGGLEKIMVEVGIAGTLAFLLFLLILARCVYLSFQRARRAGFDHTPFAALLAFMLANAAAFVVAFQLYGDPLVVFFVGLAGGVLLSGSRLAGQREQQMRTRPSRSVAVSGPHPAPATIP